MKWRHALFKFSLPFLLRTEVAVTTSVLTCQKLFEKSLREAYCFALTVSFKVRNTSWPFSPDMLR